MKRLGLVGVLLSVSCIAAVAAGPSGPAVKVDAAGEPAWSVEAASAGPGVILVGSRWVPGFDRPPVLEGSGSCKPPNTCACGIPVFDFGDSNCVPGWDYGFESCEYTECAEGSGQTVHRRVCPCQGCGATWSTNWCE